ncbi:hypothetical protein ACSYAD_15375 [Acaryochloris marina NIES-2412]|uniref:hypothetical protein n=1 Tax=Acaryochloris marina TaxID=155978 RepID=UPI004059DFCF
MKLALPVYAAILVCMSAPVASACSTSPQSDRQKFEDARTIFRARIVATSLAPFKESEPTKPLEVTDGNTITKGQYQLIETFKGSPSSQGSVVSLPYLPGSCGIPLIAGWEYVFYVGEEHGDHNYVDMTGGSFGFFNPDGKQTKTRLDQIRLLKPN